MVIMMKEMTMTTTTVAILRHVVVHLAGISDLKATPDLWHQYEYGGDTSVLGTKTPKVIGNAKFPAVQ
jgi:hypothetical protein